MSQGVQSRTETIPASGQLSLTNANFFFMISATANVTLRLPRLGSFEEFSGLQAGIQVARVRNWDYATIVGTAGTVVTFFYGYTAVREDVTLFNQQIAIIAGITAVATAPSASFTSTVDTAQASGTSTNIAANLARRRITIGVPSSALNSVRVSNLGGGGRGIEIQPGQFVEFATTVALNVRNDNTFGTGAATTWYAEEEA